MSWYDTLPWSQAPWWQALVSRTLPTAVGWSSVAGGETFAPTAVTARPWVLWTAVAIGVGAVLIPPLWRATRIGVTFVHELGHAVVGILVGRRFTGFVVRGDMSGHAVTVGKPRGAGLVLTTWAGYPAPAILAAALVWAALAGWAPVVLLAVALGCLVSLAFVRSLATAGTTLVVGAAAGALWWWREDTRSAAVLLAVAMILLLGAWRHWAAVVRSPRGSDPAVLARLTRWPGWFWVGTQALAITGATACVGWLLWLTVGAHRV